MANKSVFSIAWLLSRNRLQTGLHALSLGVFVLLLAVICLKDSVASAMQIFFGLFPYVFLLASRDVLHDDIHCGALENVVFVSGRYKSFLVWKVVSTLLLVWIGVTSIFILLLLLVGLNAALPAGWLYAYCSGLIVGIYLALWGTLLSFYIKGSANVFLVLFIQMTCAFLPVILGADKFQRIFEMIENGVPAVLSKQILFSAVLILLPNLIMKSRFGGFIPVVLFLMLCLWGFHLLKIRKLEIIKK